jgi:F-type H+-transporting ATPase subunit delta
VVTHYHKLVDVKLGRVRAEVTSAVKLSADELSKLKAALGAHTGKEVLISDSVDASLISGVVTRVDGHVIDGSLRARLDGLGASLRAAR